MQTNQILLTLYGQYSKKQAGKKVTSIFTYMCCTNSNLKQMPCSKPVHIINRAYMFSIPRPNLQKVASIWTYMCIILRVHSNHSMCLSIPKFTDLICSVHQDSSRQKVAFIWAYMCTILRVHSNHSLAMALYVQCTKTQAIKSGFLFSLYVHDT